MTEHHECERCGDCVCEHDQTCIEIVALTFPGMVAAVMIGSALFHIIMSITDYVMSALIG